MPGQHLLCTTIASKRHANSWFYHQKTAKVREVQHSGCATLPEGTRNNCTGLCFLSPTRHPHPQFHTGSYASSCCQQVRIFKSKPKVTQPLNFGPLDFHTFKIWDLYTAHVCKMQLKTGILCIFLLKIFNLFMALTLMAFMWANHIYPSRKGSSWMFNYLP